MSIAAFSVSSSVQNRANPSLKQACGKLTGCYITVLMIDWQTYWSALGGNATALLALGAVFAFLIGYRMSRQLSRFNSELRQDLAKISAELTAAAKRQEIQFSHLHKKRADIIAELYAKLVGLQWEAEYVRRKSTSRSGAADKDHERRKQEVEKLYTSWEQARMFFARNKLYFQEPLLAKITKLIDTFSSAPELFMSAVEQPRDAKPEFYKLSDEIQAVLQEIEAAFGELLAVEETTTKTSGLLA